MTEHVEPVCIRVRPRSSRSEVRIGSDGGLMIKVHAPASEGAANRECVALLAKALRVAKSRVHIVRGEKSRSKQIGVEGMSAQEVRKRLARSAGAGGRAQ